MLEKERKQLSQSLSDFYQKPVARVSVELFLSIGAVLFFAVFAIRPTLLTMSDLIKEIEDKRQLDKQMAQKIAALSSAQSEYLKLQERVGVLDEAVPTGPNLIGLFKIIEKLASDNQLVITAMSVNDVPKDIVGEPTFDQLERKNLEFTVGITGDYASVRSFVNQVTQLRRTILVDRVTFSVSDVRGFKRLDALVSINAPYYGTKK